MSKLLILGAGAEKSLGMPLANELVPQIKDFLSNDGKEFEEKLREILKGLRFSYDKFIEQAVDNLAKGFHKEVDIILENIQIELQKTDINEEQKNIANILQTFLGKIKDLQQGVEIDDETAELIKNTLNIDVLDENIINLGKLSFSKTFELVMKIILEKSIEDPNHRILRHVYKNIMDFENLLLKYFIGFYNNNINDIKKYLYISWTLWAFLIHKEKKIMAESNLNFYDNLSNESFNNIITFNYTTFVEKINDNPKYFHGSLKSYINISDRGLRNIDNYDNLDINNFVESIIKPNIDYSKNKYVIPSIIPPLKLKPVLSNQYIDIWYKTSKEIKEAEMIVIIGYSFNYADEHFNDLIRNNRDKKIFIIDPNSSSLINNLQRIFSYRKEDYTQSNIQEKTSFQKDKLTIIEAKADDININELE